MSSTTMRSLRQIRATVRATDPSALAWPIAAVRDSRVNQATRRSFSIAAWARASTKWRLAGAGRPGDGEVLCPADPFQGGQGVLGGLGDGGLLGPPGGERFPGGERGGLAAHPPGGGVAAGDFLGEQDAQDLGGVPALGAGGGEHVGGGVAQVGQAHPAQERVELGRGAAALRGRSPGGSVPRGRSPACRSRGSPSPARAPGARLRPAASAVTCAAAANCGPPFRLGPRTSRPRAGDQDLADAGGVPGRAGTRPGAGWRGVIVRPPSCPGWPSRRCRAGPSGPRRRSRPRRGRRSAARWSMIEARSPSANRPAIAASPSAASTRSAPDHGGQLDRPGHLRPDPDRAGGGGLDQPPPGAVADAEERGLGFGARPWPGLARPVAARVVRVVLVAGWAGCPG